MTRMDNPASGYTLDSAVHSANQFATDLYRELRKSERNLCFSPVSIYMALALVLSGTRGETLKELLKVMRLDASLSDNLPRLGELSTSFTSGGSGYELSFANRLWGQKRFDFRADYLSSIEQNYGATLAQVDFERDADAAILEINAWIEERTNHKIKDLVPPGSVSPETRLIITNAIYFLSAWREPFSVRNTREETFFPPGEEINVFMMGRTDDYRYAELDDMQIVELPYEGSDLSMVVFLPKDRDGLPKLEDKLSASRLVSWSSDLETREVAVFMPRFSVKEGINATDALTALGLRSVFCDRADLSGMSDEELFLSEVIHEGVIDVDEFGTEAAAATAGMVLAGIPEPRPKPAVFKADHPFVFLIRDNRTGGVLFLGRLQRPQAADLSEEELLATLKAAEETFVADREGRTVDWIDADRWVEAANLLENEKKYAMYLDIRENGLLDRRFTEWLDEFVRHRFPSTSTNF